MKFKIFLTVFLILCISLPEVYASFAPLQLEQTKVNEGKNLTLSNLIETLGQTVLKATTTVAQQSVEGTFVMGPGQYDESASWLAAPAGGVPDDPNAYIRAWWTVEGEVASWINIRPQPLNIPQGTEKWFTLTASIPKNVEIGYYEGTVHCMYAWIAGNGTRITSDAEWRTVSLTLVIDPRQALVELVDKLETEVIGKLDLLVLVSAGTMARYLEVTDVDWYKEMLAAGVTLLDLFVPGPKVIPNWLIGVKHIFSTLPDLASLKENVVTFWSEFTKWQDDAPESYEARLQYFHLKIENELPLDFTVLAGGGNSRLKIDGPSIALLKSNIQNDCNTLRGQIQNFPEEKIGSLIAIYPQVSNVLEGYAGLFLRAKSSHIKIGKMPPTMGAEWGDEYSLEYTEVPYWEIGTGLWEREMIEKALEGKRAGETWSWGSILGTGGSAMLTLTGFITGGSTWVIGGVLMSGASYLGSRQAKKYQVEASEVAIGANTATAMRLMQYNGPNNIAGAFADAFTRVSDAIGRVEIGLPPLLNIDNNPTLGGSLQLASAPTINPVSSPETGVSGEILTLSTPDIAIPEGDTMGSGTGSITIKNTGAIEVNATGLITAYIPISNPSEMPDLFTVSLPRVPLASGEVKTLEFEYFGPPSTWWGTNYLLEASVTLTTQTEQVAIGPATSLYYVGTQHEILSLQQQSEVLLEGVMDFSGSHITKDFTIYSDTVAFSLILTGSDGDFDIHLYDDQGNHVGFNYATNQSDIEILGAVYSGEGSDPEEISVSGTVSNRVFTLEVVGARRVMGESYNVLLIQTPIRSPILGTTPTNIEEVVLPSAQVYRQILIQEIGGHQSLSVSLRAEGEISSWIQLSHYSLEVLGGSSVEVNVDIILPVEAYEGNNYTGYLVVDAGSAGYDRIPITLMIASVEMPTSTPTPTQTSQMTQVFPIEILLIAVTVIIILVISVVFVLKKRKRTTSLPPPPPPPPRL